jgi:hypothetical protein
MIQLRCLQHFTNRDHFDECLKFVNTIRANYPWTQIVYDSSDSKDIWLIRFAGEQAWMGFVKLRLQDEDFALDRRVYIFVDDLHITPPRQHCGAGRAVLNHLLKKGLDLEFVIAQCNPNVWGLVRKFNYTEKYATADTATIRITADSSNAPLRSDVKA